MFGKPCLVIPQGPLHLMSLCIHRCPGPSAHLSLGFFMSPLRPRHLKSQLPLETVFHLKPLLVHSTEYPGSLVPNPIGGSVKNVIEQRPVARRSPGATHFTAASHATAIMLPSQHAACQVSTFYGPAPLSTALHSRVSGSQASAVSGSDFSYECQHPQ